MSDKLKRVLDTNLAGLHVTDAQVNAVLRRVSQDEQRLRVIRWQAIAAVLLVLVLGRGCPAANRDFVGRFPAAHCRCHPSGRFPDGGTDEKASGQRGGFAVFSG